MKILFLANCNSIHTKRWVTTLAQRGIQIFLFSFEKVIDNVYCNYSNIYLIEGDFKNTDSKNGNISKIRLLKYLPSLKHSILKFSPDIIHAHYATSYGLLGALCGFKPFILSVWGSDIFDFPKTSKIHKWLIEFNLYRANIILSTSHIMAKEIKKYTAKEITVTPFGIDLIKFKNKKVDSLFFSDSVIIGTVKTLLPLYGIDYLIQAFKIIKDKHFDLPLKLLIVGDGKDRLKLESLCNELKIAGDVIFTGSVDYEKVPDFINILDIYVALSISESFGVAILEASACEKPVIVSNVGGLPEVVVNGETGFVVEAKNPQAAAVAIERLVLDEGLRIKMGKAGRLRVSELYDWDENVSLMITIYKKSLKKSATSQQS